MGSWRRWGALLSATGALALLSCTEAPPDPAAPRPPVEVHAGVDRAVATTGDVITYTVSVEYDPQYQIDLPEPGAEIAGFRVIDLGQEEPREAEGRRVEQRWYKLRADLVGSYVLPPLNVSYRPVLESGAQPATPPVEGEEVPSTNLRTSEIFVEVESVLPADGEVSDIRDVKPLRQLQRGLAWEVWAAVAGGVIALGALGGFVWWWRRREIQIPVVPAHVVAFQALDELRRTDFDDLEAVRHYYFAISQVVRAYIEGRFGLNATDLTTEEILSASEDLDSLHNGEGELLHRFLVDTDSVKFAAQVPNQGQIEETYEQALGFVEATRPEEGDGMTGSPR